MLMLILPSIRSWCAPHLYILHYMLVLMFLLFRSRCTPYPYTALLILLLTRELYEDGEHACDFSVLSY